jgi:hypothetical protein
MNPDIVTGVELMALAAGAGAGISVAKSGPVALGARQGLTYGTVAAALVTIFSSKYRDAGAVTTAVGVAGLLVDSLIQGI